MAETSAIQWTDATVNFWWGCTKVSPACDHCYAEEWNAFRGNGEWGPNAPRRVIKGARALLRKMHFRSDDFIAEHSRRQRVFMHSMSDIFDNEVSAELRIDALDAAEAAPGVNIQIVTKRVSNVEKMVPFHWLEGQWPKHIGLMISVCNQREANRDIPRLIELKKRLGIPWIGVSMEPLLEPVKIDEWAKDLDWVIVGGESGRNARPMHPAWAGAIMRACRRAGTAFFFKQWGEWLPEHEAPSELYDALRRQGVETKQMPADPNYFSTVRFDNRTFFRAGKKRSGALLEEEVRQEFPEALL